MKFETCSKMFRFFLVGKNGKLKAIKIFGMSKCIKQLKNERQGGVESYVLRIIFLMKISFDEICVSFSCDLRGI